MWYVTCHVQKDGRVNLGTAKHADPACPALNGRTVHHIEGAIIAEIPTCLKCAKDWLGDDPYTIKHGHRGKLKPLDITCDTTVHLLHGGFSACGLTPASTEWPKGHKWMSLEQWGQEAPLGDEPFQKCTTCDAWYQQNM
jgi:hypothetical protein